MTARTLTRNARALTLAILPLTNLLFLGAGQVAKQHVVPGWVKGPLIDPAAPYAPENAMVLFSVAACVLLDVYVATLVVWRSRRAARPYMPFAAMALAFGVAEAGLRGWLSVEQVTYFRPHATLHWQVRPNLNDFPNQNADGTITTNSDGMRNVTVSHEKAPDEYRVLILGDSSNFGHGVANDEVWSAQLEAMLAGKISGKRVEVLNGACPGWTTFQAVEFLRTTGMAYHPDLVIAGFNNDPGPEYFGDKQRIPSPLVGSLNNVLFGSETYLLGREVVLSAARQLFPAPNVHYVARLAGEKPEYGRLDPSESATLVPRVPLADFLDNIATLNDMGKASNFAFIWINMPINRQLPELVERYVNVSYRAAVAKLAQERRFSLIDVDARWLRTREHGLAIPTHVFHPSAVGHRRFAQQVGHELLSAGLLPGSTGNIEIGGPPPSPTEATLRLAWSTMTPLHAYVGTVLEAHPELAEKHGLSVELHPYASGGPQGEDFAKGALDAVFTCVVPAVQMVNSRPDTRIVASPGSLGRVAVIARKGTNKLGELAGKRVAFVAGSTSAMDWATWGSGLHAVDVELKNEELEPALADGRVDAIVTWDPWVEQVLQDAPGERAIIAERDFRSDLAISAPWATYEKGRGKRLVSLISDALTFAAGDRKHWDAVVAERSGLPLSVVTAVANRNAILAGKATAEDVALAITEVDHTLLGRALSFVPTHNLTYATLVAPELLEGTLTLRRDAAAASAGPVGGPPPKGSAPKVKPAAVDAPPRAPGAVPQGPADQGGIPPGPAGTATGRARGGSQGTAPTATPPPSAAAPSPPPNPTATPF